MFDGRFAELYDLIYSARGQDFPAEADLVDRIVRERLPHPTSLLDVGCGTGEHLRWLAGRFDDVHGLDLSESMVAVARAKLPGAGVHVLDMCEFDLGRTFDVVISLSTAVAYLPSLDALPVALRRMVHHLAPGGVLVVEPWYFPDTFVEGHLAGDVIRADGQAVARLSRAERLPAAQRPDGAVRVDSHYLAASADGIEHFTEAHVFGLWSREEYEHAFELSGCEVEYLAGVQSGRGLFVARRKP